MKRQHYVPRTYLRPFAGKDDLIRVVNFLGGTEYRTSINNVAVESRFYDLEVEGVVVSAEGWLAQLEDEASRVITLLLASSPSIETLSDEQEFALARFIAAFRLRTPSFREWGDTVTSSVVSQIKQIVKGHLLNIYSADAGEAIFEGWKDKPASWWMGDEKKQQPASMSVGLLAETQGFANLVRAAPWRIGYALGALGFYTSDNPVAGYLRPVRPSWEVAAFGSFEYYLPLSPKVLLKIERRPDSDEPKTELNPLGQRRQRDFSEWEVSMARHIISRDAASFLYGEEPIVPKQCAESCLDRIGQAMRNFAAKYLS